jgi:hypothetical protein
MSFTFREKTLFEKLQKEGFNIIKLHERLEEAQIEHIFVDRRAEQIEMSKVKNEDKVLELVNDMIPFDYQILIEENGHELSLIQSSYSYGIDNNMIEIWNYSLEPITLNYADAFEFLKHKCLNKYIYLVNKLMYSDINENIDQIRDEIHDLIKLINKDKQ